MDYKCAVIICILLSAILVQGQQSQGERCSCKKFSKKLDVKKIVTFEIFPPSSKCEREEYIATVKRSKGKKKAGSKTERKCISPDMKLVKDIIGGKINRKIQVIKHPSQKE
uniref:C-X-C motif chemokine 10-3 n=1 Tax=Quasipaa spinosa TaxID=109965 RepID=A0A7D5LZA3_QUASP|nr:C-X-C motif chemokine 10-3 [Quasipaa spinosa]